MSKIYRSIDPAIPFVKQVDVQDTRLAHSGKVRPRGGFHDAHMVAFGQAAVSETEQREICAHKLIEEAQANAESIQREAYHAGFEEGERAGLKLALQKAEPALQALAGICQAVDRERESLLRQHQNELIKIAFLIAAKVVHKTVELQPEVVTEVVAEAMRKVAKNQDVTIHVAPPDLKLIEALLKDGKVPFLASDHIRMAADDAIGRGGCRLSTDTGEIDATIDGQLRALQGVLW